MPVQIVKIYAREASPRLLYIAGIILGDLLGISWEIETDRRKTGKSPVINYSDDEIAGFKVKPCNLLYEKGISNQQIDVTVWNNMPVFFQTAENADLPFDIFSASFFLVSRYEEYLSHEPDEHGRFRASSSIASKNGFLGLPLVDLWVKEFASMLIRKFPELVFRRNEFSALTTIDSDQPFAYLGKRLLYSFGGMLRDVTRKEGSVAQRLKVVNGAMKDPFDVYDYICGAIDKNHSDARFFFPTGDHSKYDKNPSWKSEEYRDLIGKIMGKYRIGIHPSYYAGGKLSLLRSESARLKNTTGTEISAGRYHFIRLMIPEGYNNMIEAGISEDYSMGYPDEPGFRTSLARPCFFYNIREERQTTLRLIPFQVMDGTLTKYKNLSPHDAGKVIISLIDETRRAGGLFVSIWHNTTLLDTSEGREWREIFEQMLKEQQS